MNDAFFRTARRLSLAAAAVAAVAPAAIAGNPSPASALRLQPIQPMVDYEKVPADQVDACVVRDVETDQWAGWEVYDSTGQILRRFVDTDDDKRVDRWCYFRYGVEIYRDIDSNQNEKPDQYRWLSTGGTRWGIDANEDGRIDSWRQISAEEVSAEAIAAIGGGDAARFERLLATETELRAAGVSDEMLRQLSVRIDRATKGFAAFARGQRALTDASQWVQFVAAMPGIVPAERDGVDRDLTVYENAVAVFRTDGTAGQMAMGTLIRVGDAWKIVSLPVLADANDPLAQSDGVFFTPGGGGASASPTGGNLKAEKFVEALEKIDSELSTSSEPAKLASLNRQRADVVEQLISVAGDEEGRETWARQWIDTVSMAVQSGNYPDGLQRMRAFLADLPAADADLRAYGEYQLIEMELVTRQGEPKADYEQVLGWWYEQLELFAAKYPRSIQGAKAKLQLALSKELEDDSKAAVAFYTDVARGYPGTDESAKATGAIRRLQSIGKPIELTGTTIDGKTLSLAQLRGRPVVLQYWATWCGPCKQDMVRLRQLRGQYAKAGLEVVGINVDPVRAEALKFVAEQKLPWPTLYAPGGLDASPLAQQFGVQTLPMMMLVDQQGRVVDDNVAITELETQLQSILK